MRKRTILAIIITILIIIATNKYWLVFSPMPVDFDIKGKGKCGIEVQLNKKDNDEFVKAKSQYIDLNLDEQAHANFMVKRSRFPKRIQIIITGAENNSPIEIKNISLKNGKYKLDDLTRFSANSGKLLVKDDTLVIYPENNTAILLYNKTLSARTAIKFDFKLLIIIAVLTFLLACKLSNYVAEFKTVKDKSRIEIVFLTIFFLFLFIPMSHINQDEISKKENRTLAKWKPLITQDGEINYNFGNDFNEWFNDRFCMRTTLIQIHNSLNFICLNRIYRQNTRYFDKNNYWAFNTDWIATKNYDVNFEYYKENILRLNDFCKKNNIKLYVLILPTKGEVYSKEFSEVTGIKNIVYNGNNFTNFMRQNGVNFIISPLEDLKKASVDDYIYPKGDVHWNQAGGYVAYKTLMNKIKQDFKNIKEVNISDYAIENSKYSKTDYNNFPTKGNLYKEMFISDKYLDVNYKYFNYKFPQKITRFIHKNFPEEMAYAKVDNNISVYYIGNSYEECIIDFIIPTFKKTVKRRYNTISPGTLSLSRYENDIINNKPDILIIQTLSHKINCFGDLY